VYVLIFLNLPWKPCVCNFFYILKDNSCQELLENTSLPSSTSQRHSTYLVKSSKFLKSLLCISWSSMFQAHNKKYFYILTLINLDHMAMLDDKNQWRKAIRSGRCGIPVKESSIFLTIKEPHISCKTINKARLLRNWGLWKTNTYLFSITQLSYNVQKFSWCLEVLKNTVIKKGQISEDQLFKSMEFGK